MIVGSSARSSRICAGPPRRCLRRRPWRGPRAREGGPTRSKESARSSDSCICVLCSPSCAGLEDEEGHALGPATAGMHRT
eukprot:5836652-Pyramimonas_sp.AAC.1